jgi:hypothetical protein
LIGDIINKVGHAPFGVGEKVNGFFLFNFSNGYRKVFTCHLKGNFASGMLHLDGSFFIWLCADSETSF